MWHFVKKRLRNCGFGEPMTLLLGEPSPGFLVAVMTPHAKSFAGGLPRGGVIVTLQPHEYDPANYNDRLLLGLKGTMSEAELHILQARMLAGRNAKARRGDLGKPLPMGYLRRPSGEVALDPDEQAQSVIRLVFDLFD